MMKSFGLVVIRCFVVGAGAPPPTTGGLSSRNYLGNGHLHALLPRFSPHPKTLSQRGLPFIHQSLFCLMPGA